MIYDVLRYAYYLFINPDIWYTLYYTVPSVGYKSRRYHDRIDSSILVLACLWWSACCWYCILCVYLYRHYLQILNVQWMMRLMTVSTRIKYTWRTLDHEYHVLFDLILLIDTDIYHISKGHMICMKRWGDDWGEIDLEYHRSVSFPQILQSRIYTLYIDQKLRLEYMFWSLDHYIRTCKGCAYIVSQVVDAVISLYSCYIIYIYVYIMMPVYDWSDQDYT